MSRAMPLRVERAPRRRATFGLDERRRPDPSRIEAEIRAFLTLRLPEVWALSLPTEPLRSGVGSPVPLRSASKGSEAESRGPTPETPPGPAGRTLVMLLGRGHAAVLRIEPDCDAPGEDALALVERCRARAIPAAVVSSLVEARAALRRFGIEPRPSPSAFPSPWSVGRCRAKPRP